MSFETAMMRSPKHPSAPCRASYDWNFSRSHPPHGFCEPMDRADDLGTPASFGDGAEHGVLVAMRGESRCDGA
jgi:hypothetical protein